MVTATTTKQASRVQQQPEEDGLSDLLSQVIEQSTDRLDAVARRYGEALADKNMGKLRQAALMGQAIAKLEAALDDKLLDLFMGLMNDKLGFMTDRAKPSDVKYDRHTVKRCIIHGLLNGVYPFNNEFNIIGGQMMIVQNGWRRKLQELKGFSDLDIPCGATFVQNGQWRTDIAATWKYEGKPMALTNTKGERGRAFFTFCDARTKTADAAAGKNLRKALKAIWEMTTGSVLTFDPEEEVNPLTGEVVPAPGNRTQAISDRLAQKAEQINAQTTAQISETLMNAINAEAERKGMLPGDFQQMLRVKGISDITRATEEQGKSLLEAIVARTEREPGVEDE